jgi:transcriptional regulator with XRE-family HTH domain
MTTVGHGQGGNVKVRTDGEVAARIVELLGDRPQRELASATGLQPSTLSRALSGKRALNMSEIVDIARYLGSPVEELLLEEELTIALRGDAGDAASEAAVAQCVGLIDAMLQIEAVGR